MFAKSNEVLLNSLEKEYYMNEKQLEYFKQKLLTWREEVKSELEIIQKYLQQEGGNESDMYDRVNREANFDRELNNKERYKQLIYKINRSLESIEQRTYGYCIATGEPIGIERLEAWPIATLSTEAQERCEKYQKRNTLQA